MKRLRRKAVGFCVLPQLMKSQKDARKYHRLYIDAEISCQIEKRRTKLEKLEGGLYSYMLEWITDNIFIQNWKNKELKAKIDEFRAFRHKKYAEFLKEREELRTLELLIDDHYRKIDVD